MANLTKSAGKKSTVSNNLWNSTINYQATKMQQQVKLLLALAILLGAANSQRGECPDQVDCSNNDPCATATCPSYENPECRVNNCFGVCTADFFANNNKGNRVVNVTEKCLQSFETCMDRETPCTIRRRCVEYISEKCKDGKICQKTR